MAQPIYKPKLSIIAREQEPLTYGSWAAMHRRCIYPCHEQFRNYGGRGIKVCSRWQSFDAFLADMGPRPSPKHSIDRIDNDGNYEPNNCRWALPAEQSLNKRPPRRRGMWAPLSARQTRAAKKRFAARALADKDTAP